MVFNSEIYTPVKDYWFEITVSNITVNNNNNFSINCD